MNIQITGDNFNVSENIKQMVEEKVGSRLELLLSKFSPDMKIATMRIEQDKFNNFKVNFDMNLPGKEHVYAETKHKILLSALIDLTQEIEKQIKRYKDDLTNYSLG